MLTVKQLKDWAALRGLALGVAPVRPFARGEAALRWREENGLITPFATGNLTERCQPGLLYPAARSLVVVAMPHPLVVGPPDPGAGLVARYALGPDYHGELRRYLRELAGILHQAGASLAAIQVDNGPLLEREAAYLAGLGYYGSSCNLIIPGMGTGASLGLIITDYQLETGQPLDAVTCGGCGCCLEACPTGALLAPGRLDPERCLSYLTQKRGIIPAEMRTLFGLYIWGCDTCQEVCPVDRREKAGAGREARWGGRSEGPPGEDTAQWRKPFPLPDLATILTMDNERFKRFFGFTAMAWRGKTILQRNAAIALGNLAVVVRTTLPGQACRLPATAINWDADRAVASLEQALRSPSPILRGHAAWALGRLGVAGRPALERARGSETDPWVREEIETALLLT